MRSFYKLDKGSLFILIGSLIIFIAIFGPWAWGSKPGGFSFFFWASMIGPLILFAFSSLCMNILFREGED